MPTFALPPFSYQGREYPLSLLLRKNNRRLRLSVEASGNIRLSAPLWANRQQIMNFFAQHQAWLVRELAKISPHQTQYHNGSQHFFLGKTIIIEPMLAQHKGLQSQLSGEVLSLAVKQLDEKSIAAALLTWYKQQASQHLPALLANILPQCAWVKNPPPIRIRPMRRQWANCASRGHLTFNTHLIKARPCLISHVILHELCHLKEFNHSKAFYALMHSIDPNWQDKAQQLKRLTPLYLP